MAAKNLRSSLSLLMDHYTKGGQDTDTRRTRKNGWNDVVNAYMGKLPANWPYLAMITDPRIRTTLTEKTGRLVNAKLQGRLTPRNGQANYVKAKINNALLDFQWDAAQVGGTMVEKVAKADQVARIFGAAFTFNYWDDTNNTNEMKVCDPRDLFWDFSCDHVKNAKWLQYREWTTWQSLRDRGFSLPASAPKADSPGASDFKSNAYESIVRVNKSLTDNSGADLSNPIVECATEWTQDGKRDIFLPRYGMVIESGESPYKHGMIPFSQLRYYPLGDDIYGESEVESVLGLQRAVNATLCAFLDEMNMAINPPVKIISGQVRMDTIEFGPKAKWIMNTPNAVTEMVMGGNSVQNFNATYPMLVAAFNTAMGDSSLGISNVKGYQTQKTATEVSQLTEQSNNRDQYNQVYLGEFLKDVMMQWLANNKQYLFDDPTQSHYVLKIVGKDIIQELQGLGLGDTEIPDEAMQTISQTVATNPQAVDDTLLSKTLGSVTVPTNPIITNPKEKNPANFDIKAKLNITQNGNEADLYMEPEDVEGEFDYIPDVKSMAQGAGMLQQKARQQAVQDALNPQVSQMLQTQGMMMDIKELITMSLEDAGYKDAERLFKPIGQPGAPGGNVPGGSQTLGAGQPPPPAGGLGGVPQVPPAVPAGSLGGGISQPLGPGQ